MDFWATFVVLLRRWYVTVPAFLLTLAAAAGVFAVAPKTFVSTSALVLTLPVTGGTVPGDPKFPNPRSNPLIAFDQGLSMASSILIQALSTPEAAARVGAPIGGRTTLKITSGGNNPELMPATPFIVITSEAPEARLAYDIVNKVTNQASVELVERQRRVNAPPTTYITATIIIPPTAPDEKKGSRLRAGVVTGVLGLFMSLCAGFAAESFARHRGLRRAARARAAGDQAGPDRGSGDRASAQAAER